MYNFISLKKKNKFLYIFYVYKYIFLGKYNEKNMPGLLIEKTAEDFGLFPFTGEPTTLERRSLDGSLQSLELVVQL